MEKSRGIIKKVQEEKKKMSDEMEEKLVSSEKTLDEERESLMHELKRGKAAALALMQVCVIVLLQEYLV